VTHRVLAAGLLALTIALPSCGPSGATPAASRPGDTTIRPDDPRSGRAKASGAAASSEGAPRDTTAAAVASTPWTFESASGRQFTTTHFNIFTTEQGDAIVSRLPTFVESAIAHYTSAITALPEPAGRMNTYVMDTRAQWVRLTLLTFGEQGQRLIQIPRGGFAARGQAFLFDIGSGDTLLIAAHEGWHQYTQSTFRERLPIWAEEGIATFMEGHRWTGREVRFQPWFNVERFDHLRDAHAAGELLTLEELLTYTTDGLLVSADTRAITWYAQVWSLVHFLREGEGGKYRGAFARMLTDAAEGKLGQVVVAGVARRPDTRPALLAGQTGPAVFRAYFEPDLNKAQREYTAFVSKIVGSGARQNIVSGKSPLR